MHAERYSVTVATAADGTGTGYTPVVTGRILSVHYAKPGSGSYSDGVDFTVTTETTAQDVWVESNVNASASRAPRQATHGTDGAAALYAAGGTALRDHVVAVRERIKIAVAQGGDTKTGTFTVIVG